MRGQRLLIVTLGVAILSNLCSSIHTNSSAASRHVSKRGGRQKNDNLQTRLSEMAKEFGATSFEETSEESTSSSEDPNAPKQHVKRLIPTEELQKEFQVYQGVMGRPGIDFPVLPSIPKTSFSCRQVKTSGYYADLDTDCQVFHICADGRKISFLCPNGTIFRQSHLTCDWWWTVDCASSREHYDESAELLAHDRKVYQERSDAFTESRTRQRGDRQVVSYDKEYESDASATVTSVNTEANFRLVAHSKTPNTGKYFASSTRPSFAKDFNEEAPFSSEDFQEESGMHLAEQRQYRSYRRPSSISSRKGTRQGLNRRIFSENSSTQSSGTEVTQTPSYSDNTPTQNSLQQQNVSSVATAQQPSNPVPTTHRPPFFKSKHRRQHQESWRPSSHVRQRIQDSKRGSLENKQFSQIQPEQLNQRDALNTHKEPRTAGNFPQPQTTVEPQTNKQQHSRSKSVQYSQQTNVNAESSNSRARMSSKDAFNAQIEPQTAKRLPRPQATVEPQQQLSSRTAQYSQQINVDFGKEILGGSSHGKYVTSTEPQTVERFSQLQATAEPQQQLHLRPAQYLQANVDFEKEAQNGRYVSSTEDEGQQLAETGSFFGNRVHQWQDAHHKTQVTTSLPSRQRTTQIAQDRVSESSNDSYLDTSRIKSQQAVYKRVEDRLSLSGRPIVVQATDHGFSGLSRSKWEQRNSADYYDDVVNVPEVEDEEPFDDDVRPPSEEQFKDEDLFYLRTSTSESSFVSTTSKPLVSKRFRTEEADEPIDLIGEFKLSESNNENLFKKVSVVKHSTSESQDRSAIKTDIPVTAASLPSTTTYSTSPITKTTTSTEASTTVKQSVITEAENRKAPIIATNNQDNPSWSLFATEETLKVTNNNETLATENVDKEGGINGKTSVSINASSAIDQEDKHKSSPSTDNTEAVRSKEFESIKLRLQNKTLPVMPAPTMAQFVSGAENFSPTASEDVPLKASLTEVKEINNNDEGINSNVKSTVNSTDTTTETYTNSKSWNSRKCSKTRTSAATTKEENIQPNIGTSAERSANLSRKLLPPRREKGRHSRPSAYSSRTTTLSPPTTVYVTLSRKVQPPVLILSSTDPREKASSKIRENVRTRNKSGKSKTELDKSNILPANLGATTPIPVFTLSRNIQPPLQNSPTLALKDTNNDKSDISLNVKLPPTFSTIHFPGQSTEPTPTPTSPTILMAKLTSSTELFSTSSSRHVSTERSYSASTLAPQSLFSKSTSEAIHGVEIGNLIRDTESAGKSEQLRQESISAAHHGNRDGLNIPPSSGPATLHSLAVYFASKENNEDTAVTNFGTDGTNAKGKLILNTTASAPTVTSTTTTSTEVNAGKSNNGDKEGPPEFLTQAIKDSYSALFPKTEIKTTTKIPPIKDIVNKDRETSSSAQNELRDQLLDKIAEMSHIETLPEAEKNRTLELMRKMPHSDTEDLLQGTDSRDLRELAQIFSRALSAYLENPEEFKRALTKIRPKEPPISSEEESGQDEKLNFVSLSTTEATSQVQDDDDEVLHFSDVSNISSRKKISTTAVPIYKSSRPLPSTFVDINFIAESSTASSKRSRVEISKSSGDVDTNAPNERLQKSESSYYSAKEVTPTEETSDSSFISSDDTKTSDFTLSPSIKQDSGPTFSPQPETASFVPTAGGVNDPTRPRYGGFQNNAKGIEQESNITSAKSSQFYDTVQVTTITPRNTFSLQDTETTEITTEAKFTILPEAIGNIIATFAPEDLNNLAVAEEDVEEEISTVAAETTTVTKLEEEESLLGANTASFGSSKVYQSNNYIKSDKKLNHPVSTVDAIALNRELSESNINEKLISTDNITAVNAQTEKPQEKQTSGTETSKIYNTAEIRNVKLTTPIPSYKTESSTFTAIDSSSTIENALTNIDYLEDSQIKQGLLNVKVNPESSSLLSDNVNITSYSEKLEPQLPSAAPLIQTTQLAQDSTVKQEEISNKLQVDLLEKYVSAPTRIPVIVSSSLSTTSFPYITHHNLHSNINCSSFTKQIAGDTIVGIVTSQPQTLTTTITEPQEDILEDDSSNEDAITVHGTSTESSFEQSTVGSLSTPNTERSTLLPERFTIRATTYRIKTTTEAPSASVTEKIYERVEGESAPKASIVNGLSDQKHSSTLKPHEKSSQEKNVEISIPSKSSTPTGVTSFIEISETKKLTEGRTQQTIEPTQAASVNYSKPVDSGNEPMTLDQLQVLEDLQTMLFPTNAPVIEDGKMFGKLNESSTLLLINTMKQAVTNSTVRRLVVLLVNSLKDGTPEETRDILIEALLRIPCERREESASQYKPVTVSKEQERSSESLHSTAQSPISANTGSTTNESTTQHTVAVTERKDPLELSSSGKDGDTLPQPDARAVELLRSLYSLASRWG